MRKRGQNVLVVCLGLGLLGTLQACGGASPAKDTRASEERPAKDKSRGKRERRAKGRKAAEAAYRKAINAEADGDLQAANDLYEEALAIDSKHRKANRRYVHFLIDNGKEKKALEIARAFYDEVPQQAISYHTLADAEAAAGEHEQVIGTMSGLLAFSESDASAFEKRGRAKLTIGDEDEGIKDIRRAVKMEPENPEFLISLGAGLLRVGKGREAEKILERAIEANDRSGRAHLLLGILARSENRPADAVAQHLQATEMAPDDARAHYELGISYNIAGDNKKAEASLAKAVDVDPNTGLYWYGYGDLLRLLDRKEESAAAYRQSVRLEPKNARAWQHLGEVLIDSGELADAAKQLRRGIAKVKEPRLYFLLGQAYAKAKKRDRAEKALERYLEVAAPDDGDRRSAEKLLRSLRR